MSFNGFNSNYPPMSQSDWDKAPWNQEEQSEREIEVTISVTLSKTMKINVNDYTVLEKDEYGDLDIDYSNCDLKSAVEEQIHLPQDAGNLIQEGLDSNVIISASYGDIANDLKDWIVDDFEVELE